MPAFSRARGAVLRVLDGLKRRPPASGAADTMSPVRKIQMLEEELRPTPELFRNGAGWQLNTFFLCLFSSIIANYKYNKVD
uniref:Uncharacterized protein n=1 Tax=Oryza meridionalis TaxID=40149 RepID=A0A0E0CG18_9ORYZ